MKRWKNIAIGAVMGLYFPVVFAFVNYDNDRVVCGSIQPVVNDSLVNRFVSGNEIKDLVLDEYAGILGRPLGELDCHQMEAFFLNHPAVKNCEVFTTCGGALHVHVTQREPLLRVFDVSASYYLDEDGHKMPLFKNHSAHVLVVTGFIKRLKSMDQLIQLARFIHKDAFWKAQIEQLYVDEQGELSIVPRVGDHIIEFGHLEDIDVKFRNLRALYTNGWNSREWNVYKKVSLKYKGQVVCTKG
ncbi:MULTISPECIES: cell division protein FtsQ/DivIB [unclassified Carboxylicivirga]|uniref:cell division protein FtsQ/DivIB n=1 Tax=Carboxylicivirga TaxID=1628153 RepID=UPI003D34AEE1